MPVPFSEWRPLIAAEIASVPESAGVFEIATLVRTVLFIGAAPESLSAALAHHLDTPGRPGAPSGRLYFRVFSTEDAERVQTDLLAEYRVQHGGALPPRQSAPPPRPRPVRHLKAV